MFSLALSLKVVIQMFCRSFIFPFLIRGGSKAPIVTTASAFLVNLNLKIFTHHGSKLRKCFTVVLHNAISRLKSTLKVVTICFPSVLCLQRVPPSSLHPLRRQVEPARVPLTTFPVRYRIFKL
jgi:hypothetical protein